uniref:hypothetical protein n=1 Tax=Nocardia suismassiliense TaxID=2077092 RepID=UPI003F4909AA
MCSDFDDRGIAVQRDEIWNTYIKLLVDPVLDGGHDFRHSDEKELHKQIWKAWRDAGVDNEVTIDDELVLSTGSSAARGSRIDFRIYHDDLHKVGVEVKSLGWWSEEGVEEQLVRYVETEQLDSILLLTADPDLADIEWSGTAEVPLFIVVLIGARCGLL